MVIGDGETEAAAWEDAESATGTDRAEESDLEVVGYNPAMVEPRMHGGLVMLVRK
jgi:hypothetical protein